MSSLLFSSSAQQAVRTSELIFAGPESLKARAISTTRQDLPTPSNVCEGSESK